MNAIEQISDTDINQAIQAELQADELVPDRQIDAQTNEGIVHLSGSIPTLQAKERALELTETIRGVRGIVNQLEVKPSPRADADIERDIIAALFFDPATHTAKIDVTVEEGLATLSGQVESWQKKELCGWVAKSVKGLRDVKNEIRFVYREARSDKDMEQEIKTRLEQDVWVGDALIAVQVKDGQASLSGLVSSVAEQSRAYFDAWVGGVTEVDTSGLLVEPRTQKEMVRESKYGPKSDEEIRKAIIDAFFYDPRIYAFMPGVQVRNGLVTLTGTVDNLKAKQAAEQTAQNTIGVGRVENYLQVRPADPLNDREIAQNVRQALLWSPNVDRHPIVVACRDGMIRLDGTVDSNYEKAQAEEVAARARGVVSIENNLAVDQRRRWREDETIRQEIERRLRWSAFLEPDQITVTIEDGKVTLAGEIDTWPQHEAVVMKALKGGAKAVVSHLRVRSASNWEQERNVQGL